MDPYQILGLSQSCSEDELKKRYRELAQQHHPDKGGNEDLFKSINDAYRKLAAQFSTCPKTELGLQPCNPNDLSQIIASFSVSVADIKCNLEIPVSYRRKYKCNICNGDQIFKGASAYAACKGCNGRGFVERMHHMLMRVQEVQ